MYPICIHIGRTCGRRKIMIQILFHVLCYTNWPSRMLPYPFLRWRWTFQKSWEIYNGKLGTKLIWFWIRMEIKFDINLSSLVEHLTVFIAHQCSLKWTVLMWKGTQCDNKINWTMGPTALVRISSKKVLAIHVNFYKSSFCSLF